MKRFVAALSAALLIISSLCIPTVLADNSVTIEFTGDKNIEPGKTYTYSYTLTCTNLVQCVPTIQASGIFENLSGDMNPIFEHPSFSTRSGTVSGKVTVTINAGAAPGQTGTLRTFGIYSYWDENSELQSARMDVKFSVSVPEPAPTSTPTSSPTPTPVPLPTVTPLPTLSPEPTPTATLSPTPSPEPAKRKQRESVAVPVHSPSPTQTPPPTPSTSAPSPTPSDDGWTQLSAQLDLLEKGGLLSMTAPESSAIPYTILKALKAKQGTLSIMLGSYTCIIDGHYLGNIPEDPDGLRLDMSMAADPAISDAADGFDIYQLHFSRKGELPGRFTYRFEAAENNPGDTVCLYCYSEMSGMIEQKQTAVVDEKGFVAFDFYSGASYFVTAAPLESTVSAQAEETAAVPSPGTPSFVLPAVIIVVAAAAVFMWIRRTGLFKKRKS